MTIETVLVDTLSLDPANARKHGERNLEAIKASLRRFGQQKPIVVDSRGVVRAGNGTLEAAKALGWREVQIVRSDLPTTELTAYSIADNRAAELAEWDIDALADQLAALTSDGFDGGELGFTDDDLNALLSDASSPATLNQLEVREPPPMTWVLIGIPTVRFDEVAATVEMIAQIPDVVLETTSNGATLED
ncbi:MAG: ParB N-terminal domain-containing protein [Tepidisphaeraceae bacterium]|jgi:ParB-like chromosome segregation protein Spo0J